MKSTLPLAVAILAAALPASAQLPAPNAAGVTAGHHIFSVSDVAAADKFWGTLGAGRGTLGERDGKPILDMAKFPGAFFYYRKGEHQGGTEGSVISYVGMKVKDLKGSLAKWAAAGITPLPGGSTTEVFLIAPDDIRVKITEDKSLAFPITADEIQLRVPDPAAAKAWYDQYFGTDIPGARMTFVKANGPVAPSKGRSFDRLGFEVTDLPAVVEKLKGSGADIPGNIATAPFALRVAILTDPFGTYIELSEGLDAIK